MLSPSSDYIDIISYVAVYKSPVYESKAFELVLDRLVSIGYPKVQYFMSVFFTRMNCLVVI